ncbi:hypothetical protein [Thermobifida cellulosilytica]|nr:hypothetical protein [Thermobifida cellulosilytica]
MQTSMTYPWNPGTRSRPAAESTCPPHAWITVGTLTSCSRCGQIDWTSSAPRLLPLALVSARALPDLWVAAPGETPAETAARWDAARHILDDLLDEVAAESGEAAA